MAGMTAHAPVEASPFVPPLPPRRLMQAIRLACIFPTLALVAGAALAAQLFEADGAAAFGAMAGFLSALMAARLTIRIPPRQAPAPRSVSQSHSALSRMELHHER